MNYELIPYTEENYDFVYQTKKNAYRKYIEECWGAWIEEEQVNYFNNYIKKNKNNLFVIKYGNQIIGFYNGKDIDDKTYEIGNICIIPDYQRQGIGSTILKDIILEHCNQNIRLQYFKQNTVGILYERLGFIPIGETEFHYKMLKEAATNEID